MSVKLSPAWQALDAHYRAEMKDCHLADLFCQNPERFSRFSSRFGSFLLDYSKNRITDKTFNLLMGLVRQQKLGEWVERLFQGDKVNTSENRAALHTALRAPVGADSALNEWPATLDGKQVGHQVAANLDRMAEIVERIHAGQWRGYSGKPVTDVVNIGVGGSDLGPLMVCHALEAYRAPEARGLRIHFVSSIDGSQLADMLQHLNQETTLFIFASKSFTTIDTLANAETARSWLAEKVANVDLLVRQHFIGCSARPDKMSEWGIPPQNQLEFWDWVGGRYSLWSAIGLPIALQIGMQGFRELLAGAHDMDRHFREAAFEQNLPVLMGVLGFWASNFLGVKGHAILPYDGRLKHFPAYLTQLEMESNGKSVNRKGEFVDYDTCPIIWGEVGPNAQHAFYQLLHQGTQPVFCDFIAPVTRYREHQGRSTGDGLQNQNRLALANCLAQSRALMLGDRALSAEQRTGRRTEQSYSGNQSSSTLLIDELNPRTLGALVALYEHKVFVQSVLWEINPFDQWGVELGKQLAKDTLVAMDDVRDNPATYAAEADSSTNGLIAFIAEREKEARL